MKFMSDKDVIGIRKLRRFLSNSDFTWYWFDKGEVRQEGSLSNEDVSWMREWTFAPFGIAYIFYLGSPYRRLYDVLIVYIATYLFSEVNEAFLAPFLFKLSAIIALPYLFFTFFVALVSLYSLYVSLRHGRRLSWNRGQWKSIQEFRASEDKWLKYNFLPSILLTVAVLVLIFAM